MWPWASLGFAPGTEVFPGPPRAAAACLRLLPTTYKALCAGAAWSGDGRCYLNSSLNKEPSELATPGGCQGRRLSARLPPATQFLERRESGAWVFSEVTFLQEHTKKLQSFPRPRPVLGI